LNATYNPSAGDILAGTVTLTLTSTGQLSPCGAATAQVVVTINPVATAGAGGNQTISAGSSTAGLGGVVGGGATGGIWTTSSSGTFAPNATTLNATYNPSAGDISADTVTLTLTSTGQLSPCGAATAQVVVVINPPAAATLLAISQTPSQFVFQIQGQAGVSYVVQSSPDLINWTDISTNMLVSSTLNVTNSVAPSQPQEFWQVVWQP
jgi:hypothetical protein